jgi:hypothetical protein
MAVGWSGREGPRQGEGGVSLAVIYCVNSSQRCLSAPVDFHHLLHPHTLPLRATHLASFIFLLPPKRDQAITYVRSESPPNSWNSPPPPARDP